jgi:3-hydroxyisobutyrate dehydrogenase-like beta-hydroxyacid dehydrogenase
MTAVGLVGLGNMGSALAANLVGAGLDLVTHDLAGPGGSPDGARFVDSVEAVAEAASVVVLSLPDGGASMAVARDLGGAVTHVVDTSTIGVAAARSVEAVLADGGIAYVDAPVSGGVAGARARTLTLMVAGAPAAVEAVGPVLAGLSDRRFVVGDEPGMGQALKLANNFLSATALAATSEALAFGTAVGLDPATMLEVLNVSSGQSAASRDKFVDHVLPGRYASGFANTLMAKDVTLYLDAARAEATPTTVGALTADVWQQFADAEPGADFTRIHPFLAGDSR